MVKQTLKSRFVYLDVCSLCRPFDDQRYLRIRIESEATKLILENVRTQKLNLAVSPVHRIEIGAIPDLAERIELLSLLDNFGELVNVDMAKARVKAERLFDNGFGVADAAHVAFAESVGADFVTCDDRLLKRCLKSDLKIWCGDPLQFCIKENLK
jgi:predicted nucleic acid-binding protein